MFYKTFDFFVLSKGKHEKCSLRFLCEKNYFLYHSFFFFFYFFSQWIEWVVEKEDKVQRQDVEKWVNRSISLSHIVLSLFMCCENESVSSSFLSSFPFIWSTTRVRKKRKEGERVKTFTMIPVVKMLGKKREVICVDAWVLCLLFGVFIDVFYLPCLSTYFACLFVFIFFSFHATGLPGPRGRKGVAGKPGLPGLYQFFPSLSLHLLFLLFFLVFCSSCKSSSGIFSTLMSVSCWDRERCCAWFSL